MATEIILVSGFLGAGKTTLVQKLLKEAFTGQRIALIENDFGEISIDAALLQTSGFQVREISSGCICCSLSGDFVKALKELLDACHPDRILIEPSGVGKLSDIIQACADARLRGLVRISRKITVVDVKRCAMYLENFGEFFEDQIRHTDAVVLSRVEAYPDRTEPPAGWCEASTPASRSSANPGTRWTLPSCCTRRLWRGSTPTTATDADATTTNTTSMSSMTTTMGTVSTTTAPRTCSIR